MAARPRHRLSNTAPSVGAANGRPPVVKTNDYETIWGRSCVLLAADGRPYRAERTVGCVVRFAGGRTRRVTEYGRPYKAERTVGGVCVLLAANGRPY